jgi:hypothetical protein
MVCFFILFSSIKIYLSHNFQDKKTPTITKTTLDKLDEHCPKLLRIFRTNFNWPKVTVPLIFARRMNGASGFRKVHLVKKKVGRGKNFKFDYDSLESCSDDDCMEH